MWSSVGAAAGLHVANLGLFIILRVLRPCCRRRDQTHFMLQANYTFYFVDKLKTLSQVLLKISSVFQSGGNGQMLDQLQVSGGLLVP